MFRVLHKGFTLAELLIALAILGVIATFTIPKILQTQQDQQKMAAAKEAAATLSEALTRYKLQVGITPNVSLGSDLFQYINHVQQYTATAQIDNYPIFSGALTCSGANPCLRLHNGGILMAQNTAWSGLETTNAISFIFDPDGAYTGDDDSVSFTLYTDSMVRSRATLKENTEYSAGIIRGPVAGADPEWFSW